MIFRGACHFAEPACCRQGRVLSRPDAACRRRTSQRTPHFGLTHHRTITSLQLTFPTYHPPALPVNALNRNALNRGQTVVFRPRTAFLPAPTEPFPPLTETNFRPHPDYFLAAKKPRSSQARRFGTRCPAAGLLPQPAFPGILLSAFRPPLPLPTAGLPPLRPVSAPPPKASESPHLPCDPRQAQNARSGRCSKHIPRNSSHSVSAYDSR